MQCDKYYECIDGRATERLCPDGLVFDPTIRKINKCDQPFNVDCGDRVELRKCPPRTPHGHTVTLDSRFTVPPTRHPLQNLRAVTTCAHGATASSPIRIRPSATCSTTASRVTQPRLPVRLVCTSTSTPARASGRMMPAARAVTRVPTVSSENGLALLLALS